MTSIISTTALLAGLVLVTGAAATGQHLANGATAAQCDIVANIDRGMLTLEGTLFSPTPMTGEYRLAVHGSGAGGTSNITQGGAFSVSANETVLLGKVMLNAAARYRAEFSVTSGGKTLDCTQGGAQS